VNDIVWIVEKRMLSESNIWKLSSKKDNIEFCTTYDYYDEILNYMKHHKTQLILPYGSFKFLKAFKNAYMRAKTNISLVNLVCNLQPFEYLNYIEEVKMKASETSMLNYPYTYTTFAQLRNTPNTLFDFYKTDELFIKSNSGERFLKGCLYDKTYFPDTINSVFYKNKNNKDFCPQVEMVIASPFKYIKDEYRCFVVDGRIVSSSSYIKNKQQIESYVFDSEEGRHLVKSVSEQIISTFVVVDVAIVEKKIHKIIEFNNPFCSGLYNMNDIVKIFNAIEQKTQMYYGDI